MEGGVGTDELCFNSRYCLFCWNQILLECFKLGDELGKFAYLKAKFSNDMHDWTEADLSAGKLQEATPIVRSG